MFKKIYFVSLILLIGSMGVSASEEPSMNIEHFFGQHAATVKPGQSVSFSGKYFPNMTLRFTGVLNGQPNYARAKIAVYGNQGEDELTPELMTEEEQSQSLECSFSVNPGTIVSCKMGEYNTRYHIVMTNSSSHAVRVHVTTSS